MTVFAVVPEGDWTLLAPLPTARTAARLAVVGEEAFVYGWNDPVAATCYKYSMNQDAWQAIASLPDARHSVGSASVGEDVFALGASTATNTVASCYKYTVSADAWVSTTSMPTARYNANVASSGFKIYVTGGIIKPSYTSASEVYDTLTDTWEAFDNLPVAIASGLAAVASSSLFVAAGARKTNTGADFVNTVYQYEFATSQWTRKTPIPTSRRNPGGGAIGHKLWVCGGSRTAIFDMVEMYDTHTDTWLTVNPLPSPAASARGAVYGGSGVGVSYIFLAGGGDPSPLSDFLRLQGPQTSVTSFQGDPLITTLSGQAGHVDLCPGVFNLFSSPAVLVNALILDAPGLPASEDMVMVGVAVHYVTPNNTAHKLYCNTTTCESSFALTGAPGSVSFCVGALTFEIEFSHLHILDHPSGAVASSDSTFLNLHIHTVASALPAFGGILGDAELFGFELVRARLSSGFYSTNAINAVCLPSVVDGPLRLSKC